MEGVAFNAVECVQALTAAGTEVEEVRVAEGGAQSSLWCAILADALGRPLDLVAERDTSAAGAALIGRAALDGAPLAEIADHNCVLSRRFEPAVDRHETLQALKAYRTWTARLLA
jgi:xylulokinase